jgi:shikimate dehydrogenase
LDDWSYQRIECTADDLPSVVSGFGPEWVGVSVTMPGKFAALRFADEHTERAELVGSANTLVRTARGWRADNTDVDGVAGALGGPASGLRGGLRRAIVLGSGGTAPAAVVALAGLGVTAITVAARNRGNAARLLDLGSRLGVATDFCNLAGPALHAAAARPTSWSAPSPPKRPPHWPAPWPGFRYCWTQSMNRGRPRWRGRSPNPVVR